MRGHRWTVPVAGTALMVGLILVVSDVALHRGPTRPVAARDGVAANPDCVRPLPLTRIMALLPDGREQPPSPGDGLGRIYHYDFDGSDVTELVPPPGWTPLTGTDQELQTYGLPARPSDPAELQDWITSFSHWKGGAAEGMCRTGDRALGSFTNHIWGGGMNPGTAT